MNLLAIIKIPTKFMIDS